jgi:DNA-binding XRE family transcriptional regulator
MVRHADSLAEVRSALVKTQDEVARVLNVKQNAAAQLEKRSDLLLSTLRKYVEAMGGELAVAVRTGAGTVIMLDSLSSLAKPSAPHRARVRRGSQVGGSSCQQIQAQGQARRNSGCLTSASTAGHRSCVRCSRQRHRKTAALYYQGQQIPRCCRLAFTTTSS